MVRGRGWAGTYGLRVHYDTGEHRSRRWLPSGGAHWTWRMGHARRQGNGVCIFETRYRAENVAARWNVKVRDRNWESGGVSLSTGVPHRGVKKRYGRSEAGRAGAVWTSVGIVGESGALEVTSGPAILGFVVSREIQVRGPRQEVLGRHGRLCIQREISTSAGSKARRQLLAGRG